MKKKQTTLQLLLIVILAGCSSRGKQKPGPNPPVFSEHDYCFGTTQRTEKALYQIQEFGVRLEKEEIYFKGHFELFDNIDTADAVLMYEVTDSQKTGVNYETDTKKVFEECPLQRIEAEYNKKITNDYKGIITFVFHYNDLVSYRVQMDSRYQIRLVYTTFGLGHYESDDEPRAREIDDSTYGLAYHQGVHRGQFMSGETCYPNDPRYV